MPAALLALAAIPLTAGTLRVIQLAGGPSPMPTDDRFAGLPLALIVHITAAAVYAVGGALQVTAPFRRAHPRWHRRAGRAVAVAGVLVAGSALWLTLGYAPQPGTGPLLFALRLGFGVALVSSLILGVTAIRRRDIAAHRAWMLRGYAIALAAGTQAFTEGIATAAFGTGDLQGDLAKGCGWLINLAVAEWLIRRNQHRRSPHRNDPHRRPRPAPRAASTPAPRPAGTHP